MYEISKLPPAITLGYQGESLARTIEVDCTDWLSDYPDGTMAATILLPGYGGVAPLPVDKAALLDELEGLNKREAVIIAALKGVM